MKKILVIEDEASVLENVTELLSARNFNVRGAEDGRIGIEIAKEFIPDLIVCDIMMPDINGYEVLEELQKDDTTSMIPFIFLTAKSELSDLRFGMELGADDYVTKPFLPNELFNTIDTRLKKIERISTLADEKLQDLRLSIASTIPHELRTPLNGILASSQILLDYYDSMEQDEIKQLHQNIFSSSKRLYDLIIRYLYFTDIELMLSDESKREKIHSTVKPLPTKSIISKIFGNSATTYEREADLSLNLDNSPLSMHAEHFQSLCEEISTNALKFSETNQKIDVTSTTKNNNFVLTVKNPGRGITKKQIQRIGAYIQFDRNIYEQQGSGLGLIIVKRLCEIYNGSLEIKSEMDKFTEIIISIPSKLS